MKLAALVVMTTLNASGVQARPKTGPDATICLNNGLDLEDTSVLDRAEMTTTQMFALIRVQLEWRGFGKPCPIDRDPILLVMMERTPAGADPWAFGSAMPYEGIHIQIFFDRIKANRPELVAPILAHVLAHEIAHVLEATDFHSATGVMKLRWGRGELESMRVRPMSFTPFDSILLHHGIDSRHMYLEAVRRGLSSPNLMAAE